ncbi:MAG: hypothetical protein HC871_07845 [Rhizobiales bacterium]|nr:hypothetical protein [Hyphomicrobiales bacterium]
MTATNCRNSGSVANPSGARVWPTSAEVVITTALPVASSAWQSASR